MHSLPGTGRGSPPATAVRRHPCRGLTFAAMLSATTLAALGMAAPVPASGASFVTVVVTGPDVATWPTPSTPPEVRLRPYFP